MQGMFLQSFFKTWVRRCLYERAHTASRFSLSLVLLLVLLLSLSFSLSLLLL